MSIFDFLTLFGGLAMFLHGMRLMGDGLKESSSGTLKKAMESVTNNQLKAFLLGLGITAIIQSSTATIVITSGLVGAGLLTLHQSIGIILGANVGTTVTGQIIRLLDLDAGGATSWLQLFKPSSLAPIALIIGIILIMGGRIKSSRQIGNIAIGFGILFSGLMNMTNAVGVLTESGMVEGLFTGLGNNPVIGYLTGAAVAFILQSSSATIGILQAFSASGMLTFKAVYPVIVGVYLGDSVTTGIVCFIGAGAEQKRVGIVNILFNIGKMALILIGVTILHQFGFLDWIWERTVNSGIIANANTVFNLAASMLLFPVVGLFEKQSVRLVPDDKVEPNKYQDKLDALSPTFFDTPALALRSLYDILLTQYRTARDNVEKAFGLIENYDAKVYEQGKLNHTAQGEGKIDLDNGICEFTVITDDGDEGRYSYEDKKVNNNEMREFDKFLYNMNHSEYKVVCFQNSIICSLVSEPQLNIDEYIFESEERMEQRESILAQYRQVLFTDAEIYNIFNCDTIEAGNGTTYVFTLNQDNYPKIMAKLKVETLMKNGSDEELISKYESEIAEKISSDRDKLYQQITIDKEGHITEIILGDITGGRKLELYLQSEESH